LYNEKKIIDANHAGKKITYDTAFASHAGSIGNS
jgi:hypothetical protein